MKGLGDVPAVPAAVPAVETPRPVAQPSSAAPLQAVQVPEQASALQEFVYAPDVIVGAMPVAGARSAPLVQTVVRPRLRTRGGGVTRQRVYYVATPTQQVSAEAIGDHRKLVRRRPFLENRIADLRRKLESMRQLADVKRAYAAQLRASIRPSQRTEAALLDSGRFDGTLNAVRGQLAALEAELSIVKAKLATSAVSEAMNAEGAVFAMKAMMPNEAMVDNGDEIEMVAELVTDIAPLKDP